MHREPLLTFILFLQSSHRDALFKQLTRANGCAEEKGRDDERLVIGWERGNESMEGPAILACSEGLSPLVCRLFPPPLFFVLELLITSLSPLHRIPHSFVILPRKRIREPSLSHHTFPLSHFAFPCLRPLAVQSAPYTVPARSSVTRAADDVTGSRGLLGRDPRLTELVSCEQLCRLKGCRKTNVTLPFQESASLVWRKCLLFQETFSAL